MIFRRFFVCAALCSCAGRPPSHDPPAPVIAATPSDAGTVSTEPADAGAAEPPVPSSDAPDAIAQAFVDAANAGDLQKAESVCTPECWQKECGSFAQQAQRKFKAARTGDTKVSAQHAVADAKVLCEGTRECDFVHLLLEQQGSAWRIADIKENDKDAASWLDASSRDTSGDRVLDAANVIARLRSGFKACFSRGLALNPKMSGAVKLTIEIGPNGDVMSATATSTGTLSPTVTQCFEARARVAKFDPPSNGHAKLVIPINLTSQ